MSRMGGTCSAQRKRAGRDRQEYDGDGVDGDHRPSSPRTVRHSVISQVPDDSIASLYPTDDNYVIDTKRGTRSPKSLVDLCVDALCRNLPYLDGELPPGLPQDVVDEIVKSLMQHSALNASTLKVLRHCEIGALSLAKCRGVSDKWLESLCCVSTGKTPRSSPQLLPAAPGGGHDVDHMDLDRKKSGDEQDDDSTASFVSASSTPLQDQAMQDDVDFVLGQHYHTPYHPQSEPTSSLAASLFLLDLSGSQNLTDKGLLKLGDLQLLEIAKLDNCHSLVGNGLSAFASSHRLHTLSLANCRRLTDEAVIHVSHLQSLEALILDGCRCLTDRSMAAISNLYELRKLDLSQCDLITNDGIEYLEDLEVLEELSLGWCRMISNRGLDLLTQQAGRAELLNVLRLSRCPINDEGIAHVARLSALVSLDLNGCSSVTSAALGNTLEKLEHLEHLDVSYCPSILRSSWQGKINSLKTLELCYSGVRDGHLARLSHLPALEELNLDSCPIGDWALAHFAENEVALNLKTLVLADTDLTDNGAAHLPKFAKLERLSLFYCNISNSGLRHLSTMTSLQELNLDSRDISDDGLAHLRPLKNLKSLDIFSGRITDAGCAHISRIQSLETLELCGGGVGDLGCSLLATMENLTSLNLSQNERITNRGAAALAALSNLRALNLSNTRVNSAALKFLSGLVNLQSLAVYGCRGVDDRNGQIDFQNGLPNLKCFKVNSPNDSDGRATSDNNILMAWEDDDDDDDESDDSDGGMTTGSHGAPDAAHLMEESDDEFEDASLYSDHD